MLIGIPVAFSFALLAYAFAMFNFFETFGPIWTAIVLVPELWFVAYVMGDRK